MRLLALYTGGKDSTLAVDLAWGEGHDIVALVTARPRSLESWMFHAHGIGVQHLQAEAMRVEHRYIEVSGAREVEVYELYEGLMSVAGEIEFDAILSGGVSSFYQRERLDRVAALLGVKHLAPCWGMDGAEIVKEVVGRGYEVVVVAVSAMGLGPEWLGRRLDQGSVPELERISERYGLSPAGEGGDYETLVLDAPFFEKTLRIQAEPVWLGDRGYLVIKGASLAPKLP